MNGVLYRPGVTGINGVGGIPRLWLKASGNAAFSACSSVLPANGRCDPVEVEQRWLPRVPADDSID